MQIDAADRQALKRVFTKISLGSHISKVFTSSRNFTTDNGVFVDEFSRELSFDIVLWFAGIRGNIFHFHYFHDRDWKPIESEMPRSFSQIQTWAIMNVRRRSELEWNAWSRELLTDKRPTLLSTWENLCIWKVFDIGKHNFQGNDFAIIFTLVNQFSVRTRQESGRKSQSSATLIKAWCLWFYIERSTDESLRLRMLLFKNL